MIAVARHTAGTRTPRNQTVSYIVATLGAVRRPTLQRALDSVDLWPGDELLVAQDDAPTGGWGANERNAALAQARGGWLAFLDDDDVYLPGHRAEHAKGIHSSLRRHHVVPIIYRMRYAATGEVLWREPELAYGNVGTPMMLVPNDPQYLGAFSQRHGQDWDFLEASRWPRRQFDWRKELVAEVVWNGRGGSGFPADEKRRG